MKKDNSITGIIQKLPKATGIYKMIDKEGKVIYIGKAKDIRKRVTQYFKKGYQHSTRTQKLVEKIHNIESIVVDSELEAIILETNLIKQLQPKYNILMKDDKNYVYIKISKGDFPYVKIVRHPEKDGAKYIGPKTAAHKIKATFKMLKKLFPFRHCGLGIELISESAEEKNGEKIYPVKVTKKVIKYPCLDYYIKRCIGPCIGKCNKEEYGKIIANIEDFLEGKGDGILKNLENQMIELAKNQQFEKAAKLRDRIQKVKDILEKQKVADIKDKDKDIINYCIAHDRAYFNLFQVREGKLIGQENFILTASEIEEEENAEVLEAFLNQYYSISSSIPKEILIPHNIENLKGIVESLESTAERKVKIQIPQKGKKQKLLELSAKNARIYADRNKPSWQEESELSKEAIEALSKILKLKEEPKRIECYDISHLSGTDTVGSMVVFKNGVPKKSHYRKFQLRTVKNKADDFKSMEEVLYRRFQKIAHNQQFKDYKIKKALKKQKADIDKLIKESKVDKQKDYKSIYCVNKGEEISGCISLMEISEKTSILNSLCIKKSEKGKKLGHRLIKEVAKKAKGKRIYIFCKPEMNEYYNQIGFDTVKKLNKELEKQYKTIKDKNRNCLVLEKLKLKEDESFKETPDLVLIDGGKGQLTSATKIFKQLNLKIPYISIAKRLEEVFVPRTKDSIKMEKNNKALQLLQRARDEAHRFAISYNRQLRSKKLKK